MDAIARSGFDYGDIPEPEVRALERTVEKIGELRSRAARCAIEAGRELKEAQDRLSNRKSGTFERWVESRCGITPRHARNFISAFETFGGKPENVFRLFDDSSMFLLSAPSCPEDARNEALKLANSGKPVTHKVAKEIVEKHRPKPQNGLPSDYSPHGKPKKRRKKQEATASSEGENPESPSEAPAKPTQADLIDARDEQPETTPTQSAPTEQQVIAQLSALVRAIHGLPATEATKHAAKLVDQALETLMTGQVPETAVAPELSVVTPEPEPADAVMTFDTVPGRKSSSATWALTQDFVDELQEAYPGVDVPAQCRKARLWCQTNKAKRKTAKGMPEFLRRWMESAQNSGRDTRGKPADRLSVIDDYIAQYGESA